MQIPGWHRADKTEKHKKAEAGVRSYVKGTSLIGEEEGIGPIQEEQGDTMQTQCNRVNAGSSKSMNCRVQVPTGSSEPTEQVSC